MEVVVTLSRWPALNVKLVEIQTSADPAVLWLRARQLCYLGGYALQSGEIIGILQKLTPLVQAKENEVATVGRSRRAGEPHFRWQAVIGVGGGAPEKQSRRTQEQMVAEEVVSAVDEEVSVPARQHG